METNQIEVNKIRSLGSCLGSGLALPMKNFSVVMKLLWPMLLLVALSCALLQLSQSRCLSAISYQTSVDGCSIPASAPSLALLLVGMAVFALSFLLSIIATDGTLVWHQRRLMSLGYLPSVRCWHVWRDLLHSSARVLKYSLFQIVVCLPVMVLYAVSLFLQNRWLLSGAVILLIICSFILIQIGLSYLWGGENLRGALRSFRWSRRYMGRTFLLVFLAGLLSLLCYFVLSLPSLIIESLDLSARNAQLQGDSVSLPGYFVWLRFVALLISGFSIVLVRIWNTFILCFHWGSIRTLENERMKALEQVEA